jgi:hypothetical protein
MISPGCTDRMWVRGHRVRAERARAGSAGLGGGALRCLADSESPSPKKGGGKEVLAIKLGAF